MLSRMPCFILLGVVEYFGISLERLAVTTRTSIRTQIDWMRFALHTPEYKC
jgi:hypothetical protein